LEFLVPAVLALSIIAFSLLVVFFRSASDFPRMIRVGELQLATTSATAVVLLLPIMDPRLMLFILFIFLLPQVLPYLQALYRFWSTRFLRPTR
jgi:hypothetical protein